MKAETLRVQGTLQPDGTLVLDEKLALPAGRVCVTIQPLQEPEGANPMRLLAVMKQLWAGQQARGHVPRNRDEIDAEINQLRNEAEEEMQTAERLHQECRSAHGYDAKRLN
jgi:hypothetical protein